MARLPEKRSDGQSPRTFKTVIHLTDWFLTEAQAGRSLGGLEIRVALAIAKAPGMNATGKTHVSYRYLAQKATCDQRHVQRIVRMLGERGVVARDGTPAERLRVGSRGAVVTRWTLNQPSAESADGQASTLGRNSRRSPSADSVRDPRQNLPPDLGTASRRSRSAPSSQSDEGGDARAERGAQKKPAPPTRAHERHAWCGDRLCVPNFVHDELTRRLSGDNADAELRRWYAQREAAYVNEPISTDWKSFWFAEFRHAVDEWNFQRGYRDAVAAAERARAERAHIETPPEPETDAPAFTVVPGKKRGRPKRDASFETRAIELCERMPMFSTGNPERDLVHARKLISRHVTEEQLTALAGLAFKEATFNGRGQRATLADIAQNFDVLKGKLIHAGEWPSGPAITRSQGG
jgi:hypothetical protein